ncbi:MAG: tRNA threonylcarbamoyl adenosine modification protein YeaZ [Planctomycetota bacterium]
MIEVALEASGRPGSVAARRETRKLNVELGEGAAHASDLLGMLNELVLELDGTPQDISAVFVGTGPGSFTGLRVAIATAMGIARGTQAQVRSVPSFDALVFEALEVGEEAYVLLDAYSSELYLARYRRDAKDVVPLTEPHVIRAAPFDLPSDARLIADAKSLRATGLEAHEQLVPYRTPSAQSVLELGAYRLEALGAESPESIEPLYLRPFAAKKRQR